MAEIYVKNDNFELIFPCVDSISIAQRIELTPDVLVDLSWEARTWLSPTTESNDKVFPHGFDGKFELKLPHADTTIRPISRVVTKDVLKDITNAIEIRETLDVQHLKVEGKTITVIQE